MVADAPVLPMGTSEAAMDVMPEPKGQALMFVVNSGPPGYPVGSGCAAAPISVPYFSTKIS